MNQQIEYYVQGHTGKGYVNYIEQNITHIEHIVCLHHNHPYVITLVLEKLIEHFQAHTIEKIKSIESEQLIEGIIVRELSLAILNARVYDGKRSDINNISVPTSLISSLDEWKVDPSLQMKAYEHFAKGLSIHEQLEQIYINEMDFAKADEIIENLLTNIFKNVEQGNKHRVYERLFGTNTPDGIVNVVPQLIQPIDQKIFILGRAGTGKSFLMNKVLEKCRDVGIDVELYRCSLDPDSIDMLMMRELNVCIHDNTAPHTIPMTYPQQQIIDMYKETVHQRVEQLNKRTIETLQRRYRKEMQTGISYLKGQRTNIKRNDSSIDQTLLLDTVAHIKRKII